MNNEHQTIADAFDKLQKHPYTLISLSDREKFHTGMLAFVINKLDQTSKIFIIKQLWGVELPQEDGEVTADVEWQSIDLIVRQNKKIVLWAEAKFKTTLGREQIAKYEEKLPRQSKDAKGVLFALFTEVDLASGGIDEVAFHNVIIEHQKFILSHIKGDCEVLVRLWVQYLEPIQVLTRYIKEIGVNSVSWTGNIHGSFSDNLYRIKLKGIFEHYRHSVFRENVEGLIKERINDSVGLLIPNQFNSHGNSGIEYVVYPFDNQTNGDRKLHPDNANGHMRYGLQWQAGSLKLSIDVAKENFYTARWAKSKKLKLADVRSTRDAKLLALYGKFLALNWADKRLGRNNKSGTKFKSYTIAKWDIFNPQLGDKPATLQDLASVYVERLDYLMNQETQKFIRHEIQELPA